jgi:tetratricopeptide (TPR) repeat protein
MNRASFVTLALFLAVPNICVAREQERAAPSSVGGGLCAASLVRVMFQDEQGSVAKAPDLERGSSAQVLVDRAKRLLQADNLSGARVELERALKVDPRLAEAYVQLGTLEYRTGAIAQSIAHLRRAVDLVPGSFDAHYGLALASLRDRRVEDGRRELDRAHQIDPLNPDASYNLGILLLDQRKPADAEKLFQEVKRLGPNRADVSFYFIYAKLEQLKFDEARQEANEGAKIFGKDVQWRSGVGRLFLEHNQPREASEHLEAAVHLKPDSTEVRRSLATARLQLGNPSGALAALTTIRTADDHYLRASALYLLHAHSEAAQESREALRLSPDDPRYLLLGGRIAQRAGQHAQALEFLQRAVRQAPKWSEPYYSEGVSYYLLRRYEEARHSLQRAIEIDPKSSRALFVYAATLANEAKIREAEDYFHRALALEPTNARFLYHLGALQLRDNRPQEARKAFERSVQLKTDYPLPHYQLGKIFILSNQPKLAARELERAVFIQPDLAQAYYQLSRAYSLSGERNKAAEAISSFKRLKKEGTDEDREYFEGLREEIESR